MPRNYYSNPLILILFVFFAFTSCHKTEDTNVVFRDFYAKILDYTTARPIKNVKVYLSFQAPEFSLPLDNLDISLADSVGIIAPLFHKTIIDSVLTDENGYFYFRDLTPDIDPNKYYQITFDNNHLMRVFRNPIDDLNRTTFYADQKRVLQIETINNVPQYADDTLLVSTKLPEPNFEPFYLTYHLYKSIGSGSHKFNQAYSFSLAKQAIIETRYFRNGIKNL